MVLLCTVHVTYNVSLIIIIIILLSFICKDKMYNKNKDYFHAEKTLLNIYTENNHSQTTKHELQQAWIQARIGLNVVWRHVFLRCCWSVIWRWPVGSTDVLSVR